ncbi:phage tail protein [Vibrio scophthalmi]|uniref:Phage tail protein n=1 Tax=Vibrio scophthalmi TaxID=45658 RepID=A0A1E3WJ03_9VIBR|nr:phage tail protein [Vibrio scophthalmi]ODS09756.1 hypothetical protein VSF3289_03218 [Vibrio scophthalmi]
MNQLQLLISGSPVPFFSADINYSLDQLAHTFSCSIPPVKIDTPLPVEFRIQEQPIFFGQIDAVGSSTSTSAHQVTISGRSQSANMIDSRITMDALYDQDIVKLLQSLAGAFGLGVKSLVKNMPLISEFQITAESPVENIAQLIREQNLMLIERNGVLTIENPAHACVDGIGLEVGYNIESLDITRSFEKQFHKVEVQGAWDEAHAVIKQPGINPSRTIVLICDQLQSAEACLSRAQYERNRAIAEGLSVSTSIANIFIELAIAGLNRSIRVIDEKQGFNEMMLIKSLGLSVTDSSTNTTVGLMRPFKEQSYV